MRTSTDHPFVVQESLDCFGEEWVGFLGSVEEIEVDDLVE